MKNTTKRQNDPNVYAVLHRSGRVWRAMLVRQGPGRDANGSAAIVSTHEFPDSMVGRIESWLDEHSASEVLCVLPASAVICRTCPLPDAPMDQLEPALRLQAEAHLFGIAPTHRLGMAVLEQAPGETERSGIILAWPESTQVDIPVTSRPISFAPDIAAVAALIDGHRPAQPLLWVDRATGSVAMALSHASGVSFRAVREDDEDDETWRTSVTRAIAETGLNAGHTADFIEHVVDSTNQQLQAVAAHDSKLIMPDDVVQRSAERLTGTATDEQWWSRYGIAAGAVLLRSGPLASLAQLRQSAPQQAPSRLRDVVKTLSSPRAAWALAIAAVIVLMFGPLATNWARLKVLELRHSDIRAKLHLVNEVRDSLVVYRELGNTAWPMTKVLSDIASNTPEGVELESIRVNPGGAFTTRGRALPHNDQSATERVVQMQQNLRSSGIFTEITLNWGDSDAYGNYEFEIAARLLRPYRHYDYPEELDFASTTLAERLYGPAASSSAQVASDPPAPPDSDAPDTRPSTRMAGAPADSPESTDDPYAEMYNPSSSSSRVDRPSPRSVGGLGGDAQTRESVRGGAGGVAPSQDIPAEITEAQVQAMSDAEVLDHLIKIGHARRMTRNSDDEELKARLQREFDWLMARRRGDS